MIEKGYIHLYYGNGKGKTSILNGSLIRALSYNLKVEYLSFLKNINKGEFIFFKEEFKNRMKFTSFYHFSNKFIWNMNDEEKIKFKNESLKGIEYFKEVIQRKNVDLVIADEIIDLIYNNFITEKEFVNILKLKNSKVEIMMSGHKLPKSLLQVIDLASEVKLKKHYFYNGVKARKGIEY